MKSVIASFSLIYAFGSCAVTFVIGFCAAMRVTECNLQIMLAKSTVYGDAVLSGHLGWKRT